jgi:hypothetical protein
MTAYLIKKIVKQYKSHGSAADFDMEELTRCGRNDDRKYDDRTNGSCFNESSSLFVLQRYEVWVGNPVGSQMEQYTAIMGMMTYNC